MAKRKTAKPPEVKKDPTFELTAEGWFPVVEVNDVDMAFPARKVWPDYEVIPDKYKRRDHPYVELFSGVFFDGKSSLFRGVPREGIDPEKAWRHLVCVFGTYGIQHEHKEAAVCFLIDSFFRLAWFEGEEPQVIKDLLNDVNEDSVTEKPE